MPIGQRLLVYCPQRGLVMQQYVAEKVLSLQVGWPNPCFEREIETGISQPAVTKISMSSFTIEQFTEVLVYTESESASGIQR